jgi:flagellar biosynthesis protein FlhF
LVLRTFSAATMAEALLQVKREYGPDAVILHTRTVRKRYWLGLRQQNVVEVTASPSDRRRPNANSARNPVSGGRNAPSSRNGVARNDGVGATLNRNSAAARPVPADVQDVYQPRATGGRVGGLNPAAAAYARNSVAASSGQPSVGANPAPDAATPRRSLFDSPEMTQAMVKLVTEEVTGMRSELQALVTHVKRGTGVVAIGNSAKAAGGAGLPEQLFNHYQQLIENQVAEELAEDILKSVRLQIPAGYLGNEPFVREKVAEQVEKLLPAGGAIKRTKSTGPHVVALIGPTGVGKTTTIAKLAANLQLREGKRVGLITIDTYRIAAVDQLRRYADIIGSPLSVVGTPEDMPAAIAAMGEMDYVLIDTAGRSPSDSLKLSELRKFIEASKPDEVHLVLSTTSSPRCVEMAVEAFSKVRVDKLLFTKIDEAATVGLVLNVARKVGKALSYVTTGQDVPDDIEVVSGRKIARMILSESSRAGGGTNAGGAKSGNVSREVGTPRVAVAGGVK